DLRRMALGGLMLEPLSDAERAAAGVPEGRMALRVKHVGQYGDHAVAMRAGVKQGDILIGYDGRDDLARESDIFAQALQQRRPGDEVILVVLRDGQRREATIRLQ